MSLSDYIQVTDNALKAEEVCSLIQWLNKQDFHSAGIIGREGQCVLNKEIRDVGNLSLSENHQQSFTRMHWCNFLTSIFRSSINQFQNNLKMGNLAQGIRQIEVLKYSLDGHYSEHVDDHWTTPRTFSNILFLNNDYEGGALQFHDPKTHNIYHSVDVQVGRLITWPSNFLFPHSVRPITKGLRYSVVAWAY